MKKWRGRVVIYTAMTKKAMILMYKVHQNQRDRGGIPYVFHPWHVAEQMDDENSTTVALLHDVVEDGAVSLDHLRGAGFAEEIIEALELLTRHKGQNYFDYIEKLAPNPLARRVKLADLAHNQDVSRLDEVDAAARRRIKKYQKAQRYLEAFEKNDQ